MDIRRILSAVDHTLLSPVATQAEVYALCDEAIAYRTASVCIPPAFVASVRDYVTDKMRVCTVVGFPNGYNTTASKVYEARNAIENGADEIDMVINIGWLRDKKYAELLSEIKAVRAACTGKILKVIVETCLLAEEEKIKVCGLVAIHRAPTLKIKAAGGISSLADAEAMLSLGADRLGTSRIVKLVKELEKSEMQIG